MGLESEIFQKMSYLEKEIEKAYGEGDLKRVIKLQKEYERLERQVS